MELSKRKYKRVEVEQMIDAYKSQYENLILDLRTRISELDKENKALLQQVEQNKDREGLIIKALERAEESAEQIKEQAQLEYALELQRLGEFTRKWDRFFNTLKDKFPTCDTAKKALEIKDQVKNVSKKSNAKQVIEKIDSMISEQNKAFNPKSKIKEYISATTSESGFNLNDV